MPAEIPFFFLQVSFGYPDFFFSFLMKLSFVLSRCVKNCAGILMAIKFTMCIVFGKIIFFARLIITVHEHERSFHLLLSSSASFFKDLKNLSYRFFTCLSRVNPRCFILFLAIVNSIVSLISFSSHLSFVYKRVIDFSFLLILYPVTLMKVLYQL